MNANLISLLKTLIEEGGNKDKIEAYEDAIVEEIEKYVKEESFYELPTDEILKILRKSNIEDVDLLCEVISRIIASKGEESALLISSFIGREETFEECIKLLSMFKQNQLFQ